ncbi:hypothetical protein [Citrobacter sp. Cpo040]|uniref:GapS4a family protein n=1 Tax=Citrobacter sp. Cpo040 TaxID=2985126 RepID=UPI002576E1AE|nr:hypothetical protein [Citrobacter sp. Cpo040]MDM2875355.1 hypothetical protein [Citrobacter sp. Cpo040]
MGEFSKLVGDYGEDIVSHFLNIFGWENHATNKYVDCRTRKHGKNTHGIDALFVYDSPLESKTIENVIVSSKYSSNPYAKVNSTFKAHFEDIATAIECYAKSQLKKDVNQQIISAGRYNGYNKNDTGVLFYINNDTNPEKQDVISLIKSSQISNDIKYRTIHVVDNKKAAFLFESIHYIKNKFGEDKVNFFYPPTSLNLTINTKRYFGKVFPVEYVSSPIIPFVITRGSQEQPIICMVSSEPFSADSLEHLISCTRNLVSDISKNLLFVFNSYNKLNAKEDLDRIKMSLDRDINIEIDSYNADFRG